MKNEPAFLTVGLVISLIFSASVQAKQNTVNFDCDTAAGHFSELTLPVPDGAFAVKGRLSTQRLATDKEWSPVARISIAQATVPGTSPGELVGISIDALPADKVVRGAKKTDIVEILNWNESRGSKASKFEPIDVAVDTKEVTFSFTFGDGNVLVTVNGKEKNFLTSITEPVVRIICSTGEFLFSDVSIQKIP